MLENFEFDSKMIYLIVSSVFCPVLGIPFFVVIISYSHASKVLDLAEDYLLQPFGYLSEIGGAIRNRTAYSHDNRVTACF